MSYNPFNEMPKKKNEKFMDWKQMSPKPYNKETVDPYTKTRIILANGGEYEAVWFTHNFHRNCTNMDIRRELAIIRRNEQQQQKRISALRPENETMLETTISYEQLAVDLTAEMAENEKHPTFKKALEFALLEDFDHLYRYADLLEMQQGVLAEKLVGGYTEIMPGRPTISEHRFPADDVKIPVNNAKASLQTKLNACIITAAEQQTMNYYMNIAGLQTNALAKQLYTEIGMIEEQHVTQYGSFIDPSTTPLEKLLFHEYSECYMYYSNFMTETDERIKKIWEECLEQELYHLYAASQLLKQYDKKEWQEVIPDGTFPSILTLQPHKEYIRNVIANSVWKTAYEEDFVDLSKLPDNYRYFKYQNQVNSHVDNVASHVVIDNYIAKNGEDYRMEDAPHPIEELQDRHTDNTTVARQVQ